MTCEIHNLIQLIFNDDWYLFKQSQPQSQSNKIKEKEVGSKREREREFH